MPTMRQGKAAAPLGPRMQRFTWNADGTPNFGVPVAAGDTYKSRID